MVLINVEVNFRILLKRVDSGRRPAKVGL